MKNKHQARATTVNKDITIYIPWLLMVASILLYGWTAKFNFGLDDSYITVPLSKVDNTFKGFLSLLYKWYDGSDYRPITMMSFWIERQIFGEIKPGTSHLINVLIFGLLLTRIFKYLQILRPFSDTKKGLLFSTMVCIFFLVHTNHVSVVANIKSRDSLLSMLFGVIATIQFMLAWDKKQYYRFALFVLFMLMGLWSKLDAYSFLFLPILSILFFREFEQKKMILLAIIYLSLFGIITHLRVQIMKLPEQNEYLTVLTDPGENPLAAHDTLMNRLSMACISLFYYVKFCILPVGYYFFFGYNMVPLRPLFHPINIGIIVAALAILAACIYMFKKNRLYLFAYLYFGLAIAYALNLFNVVAGIVADRYNFIPSLAFCIALAALLMDLLKLTDIKGIFNKYLLVIIIIYCGFTISRTGDWKDTFTLYLSDIPHLENSYNANRILSAAYVNMGLELEYTQPAVAEEHFKKADEYADRAHNVYQNAGATWAIKGITQLHWQDNRKALEYFKKSESVDSTFLSSINYIGLAYRNMGMMDSAYYYFHKVMLKENFYNYSADNLINWYIDMKQPEKLDSLIQYYNTRFPDDMWLKKRIEELKQNGYLSGK
ncbi:MAG: hypothetical protein K1X55_07800 [Chitinophagales bacterium]|nr:hypothetical protein [Chitinophagales bacterium]